MLKLLRKYQMLLLVVFGVFLMVVFLLPQGMSRAGPSKKGPIIGSIAGTSFRQNSLDRSRGELELLSNFARGGVFQQELGLMSGMWELNFQDDEHWFLLVQAAKRGGFVAEAGDGQALIDQMATAFLGSSSASDRSRLVNQFAGDLNARTEKEVFESLANIRGVLRMFGAYAGAARTSAPRVLIDTKHNEDRATVSAVFIPGAAEVDPTTWQPTEAELVAHFEKYRNTKPTEGEFGIGYLLPNRLKLEILEINSQATRDTIIPDRIAMRRAYDLNRTTYTGEFAEHKDEIELKIKDDAYEEILATIRRAVRAETHTSLDSLRKDADGYRVLPDGWNETMPRFATMTGAIVEQVKDELDRDIPAPIVRTTDAYMTGDDIVADESLGRATISYSGRNLPLPGVLFAAKEFSPPADIGVQAGVPLLNFEARLQNGDMMLVTILDAVTESPAADVEEVREQVTKDIRSLAGYEILSTNIESLEQQAINGGLTSLIEAYPSADAPAVIVSSAIVSRRGAQSSEPRFNDELFCNTVIDHTSSIDPLKPIDQTPQADRLFAIALPQKLGVAVVSLDGLTPLTRERLRVASWNEIGKLQIEGLGFDASNPETRPVTGFTFDALSTRLGWAPGDGLVRRRFERSGVSDELNEQVAENTP